MGKKTKGKAKERAAQKRSEKAERVETRQDTAKNLKFDINKELANCNDRTIKRYNKRW